jgi:glycerol-3-phosphate dehydrogenase (NAD+)
LLTIRGTTIAKIVAENAAAHPNLFQNEVRMWVYEELVEGRKLSEIINQDHENVRYLPGIKLPNNLVADPDIKHTVEGADIIVFNIPHQFLKSICKQLQGTDFSGARAVSCLKGLTVDENGVYLLSDYIQEQLGLHCGVLSGANLAPEVAQEKFSETTVAYPKPKNYFEGDVDEDLIWTLFHRPYFHVSVSDDTAGVSIGGALKNVVAIGAGLVYGAGWGDNAKAAIMRRGLMEMIKFAHTFFPSSKPETFTYESAGLADLITSCAGGRNVRVGVETAKSGKPIEEVEKYLLDGQSAQGITTMKEVYALLTHKKMEHEFPLLIAIYDICYGDLKIDDLPKRLVAE